MRPGTSLKPPAWLAYIAAICISCCVSMVCSAQGLVDYGYVTRYGYTGDERTIAWGQDQYTLWSEVEIELVENGTIESFMTNPPLKWTPQRAGHYVIRARNCNDLGCSAFTSSTDLNFWLFFWIKAPGFP